MDARQNPILWTIAAVVLSAVTAFVVARQAGTLCPGHGHSHEPVSIEGGEGGTFHDWLHTKLEITPAQEARLAPIERSYAEKRADLLLRVESAGHRLAAALDGAIANRAEVDASLAEIHTAQSELQQLTINHFLEMKEHLSPDQAAKLLQWTRESITHEHPP